MQYMIAPAQDLVSVVPADGADQANGPFRAILVGTDGDVKITTMRGTVETAPALVAGIVHPICAKRIWAGGTTATIIKAVPFNDHVQPPVPMT